MSSRSVSLTSTFLLLAAGGAAACDNDDDYQDAGFYCANEQGVVVDDDECDDDDNRSSGLGFIPFIWYSSLYRPGYPVGTVLPAGGNKFAYNDRAARQSFGLPATGKISNGTIKTSVIGKGGTARGSSKSSGG